MKELEQKALTLGWRKTQLLLSATAEGMMGKSQQMLACSDQND